MGWTWMKQGPGRYLVFLGCLAASAVLGGLARDYVFPRRSSETAPAPEAAAPDPEAAKKATTVALPEGKFQNAGLKIGTAEVVELPAEVGVTGRIEPNFDRRVEIRPRAAGVIRNVNVVLGQEVKQGDLLLTLDSPDIGTARLNLRARQRELRTARAELDWRRTIASNVEQLVPALRKQTPAKEIEAKFANRPLGANRETLLSAYAELELAAHEEEKQTQFFKDKIVGEHVMFAAVHTRESKQARFEAALEQVTFDASQQKRVADQNVKAAEGAVIDAAQRLRILGVVEDIPALLNAATPDDVSSGTAADDVTAYPIAAPFAGRIIARTAVPSQRAEPTDVLLVLADLTTVRVSADIPESALSALHKLGGEATVRLTAEAYPGKVFQAKILSVGSQVDPMTRTVPILAETANAESLLYIGMFVRVVLQGDKVEKALTVPNSAVVEIEGQSAVFLPASEPRTYTFHKVSLGREAEGRYVVKSGLKAGQEIVTAGAFMLKSELILQNETEEE